MPSYVQTFLLPLILHFPSLIVSGVLYWKIWKRLKSLKQLDRKDTLSLCFIFLWVSWMVLVLPYVLKHAFLDSPLDGIFSFQSDVKRQTASAEQFIDTFLMPKVMPLSYDYSLHFTEWHEKSKDKSVEMMTAVFMVDTFLKTLKLSFGFFNSAILIVLIKPFYLPLIKSIKTIVKKMKNLKDKLIKFLSLT